MVFGSGHKLAGERNRHWPLQWIAWLYDTGPTPPTAIIREGGGRESTDTRGSNDKSDCTQCEMKM